MGRHKKNSANKKRAKKERESENSFSEIVKTSLKTETKYGALAIICLVVASFFLLSAFNKAGAAGQFIYQLFSQLFGAGFYFIPLIFLFLTISFIRSMRPNFVLTRFIGGLVLFLSSLSLLSLIFSKTTGGWVGNFLARPLLSLFDWYLSLVTLVAASLVSLLVIFDTGLNLNPLKWFKKKDLTEEDLNEEEMAKVLASNKNDESENKVDEANKNKSNETLKTKKDDDGFLSGIVSFGRRGTSTFSPPPLSLLESDSGKPGGGDIKANMNIIKRTLANFGINVEMDEVSIGPSVTRYALKPAEGMKLSRILGLQNDLSLALAAHPLRIEAPIPGKSLVGIEVPNTIKSTVGLATLLGTREFSESPHPLYVALGKGLSGSVHYTNLAKSPHLLIAGATGSGKSVTIHTLITSLLYRNSPDQMRFIMIDPKRVELTLYNKIPHLLTPVITDAKKAISALRWAAKEMDRRYDILEAESVRDVQSYHKNILAVKLEEQQKNKKRNSSSETDEMIELEQMPYIVIIIDELADIMSTYPRELETAIVRLAQMSRAVGIHLMLSTQRPSVEIITGLIKANIPSRLALQVTSQIDSRTIIDMAGAEKLLGAGDMLFLSGEMSKPARIQSAFISENEVKKVVAYIAEQYAGEFIPNEINFGAEEIGANKALFGTALDGGEEADDELYEVARESVIEAGKASASYLQRKLKVGYARAARLLDILEENGVIGPGDGAKPREVYTARPSETVELDEIKSDETRL
ncbi:MAG: cell division protein FtsK [Candidatus Vogelbacteria bacterium CG22_combo_CG10-13_8_21_14_all_37_9]|uniref:Cell division protein FtsK n=1 Tax=Candidatus Vogelbacteria bacterium CG22_combo_CG10-13_8_21_14_all_37_9 TaxID=1975046 RepID=A0A2H0BK82_9BACT|nr:MAG: cell division protein FtsK [Candidatus Vogelbacteria bacterium CG22_combo_CG10-13_8_21_14_all_37_9]